MARLIYACRFNLQRTAAAELIVDQYAQWISDYYLRNFEQRDLNFDFHASQNYSSALPQSHELAIKLFSDGPSRVHEIIWAFPSSDDPSLIWRNEVRVGLFDSKIGLEHSIWLDSRDFLVAPARFEMGSPRIIRQICTEQTVTVGEMQIKATPYDVKPRGVDEFVSLLTSTLRRLPIVFLSPYSNGAGNQINGQRLAAELAGVAVIVLAHSATVTWDIADRLGRPLSCFDGAVRIYWPNFSVEDAPRRHPLYLATKIATFGPRSVSLAVQRSIFSVASFRFVPDPRMNSVVRAQEDAERLEKLSAQKTQTPNDWEQIALDLDQELSKATGKLTELEAENENLKANQKFVFSAEADQDVGASPPNREPGSNVDAVRFAEDDCENLVVLKSAHDAAKDCPFKRPQEIYDALRDLNEIAANLKSESASDLRQQLIDKGWGKRCSMFISETTKRRHGGAYTFEYNKERRLFEPHITLGSGDANTCASIHFILDGEKIIIAHAGRHLPNTKT